MNSVTDQQLLRDYAGTRSEQAFAELVRRYVDLVYTAAVRMVRDADLAKDITQSVFVALAQNAAQLGARTVLSGWLHRTTHNIACNAIRFDVRRRAREHEAAKMNELLSGDAADPWQEVSPHLDAALNELAETDRDAILLRFFEHKSARDIANVLGTTEEAAQKRVNRAVERLRECFARRGVPVAAVALTTSLSTHAITAAPATIATAISSIASVSALAAPVTTALALTKTALMTTLQKTIVGTTLVAAIGVAIYEAQQVSALRQQVKTLQQASPISTASTPSARSNDSAAEVATLRAENDRLKRDTSELLKLRGELARLRRQSEELTALKSEDPVISEAVAWHKRVESLKQHLEQNPNAGAPELQLATEKDWLDAARGNLETPADYRRAMSGLRGIVANKLAGIFSGAIKKFVAANNKQPPTDLSQLLPHCDPPLDPWVVQRYAIVPKEEVPNVGVGPWLITQKFPIDEEFDSRIGIGENGYGSANGKGTWKRSPETTALETLDPVIKAYSAANNGQQPIDIADLQPYLQTPEQQNAFAILKAATELKQ